MVDSPEHLVIKYIILGWKSEKQVVARNQTQGSAATEL